MIVIMNYNKLLPARDVIPIKGMNTNLREREMIYSATACMAMHTNVYSKNNVK